LAVVEFLERRRAENTGAYVVFPEQAEDNAFVSC
jgi:hypothetical protein